MAALWDLSNLLLRSDAAAEDDFIFLSVTSFFFRLSLLVDSIWALCIPINAVVMPNCATFIVISFALQETHSFPDCDLETPIADQVTNHLANQPTLKVIGFYC